MRKRLFLVLICLILLTGCDVTYDLTIDSSDNFKEKVTMSFLKSNTSYNDILVYKENKTPISNMENETKFYNSSIKDAGDYYNLIYDYDHDMNGIKSSYFISNCYHDFTIHNDNDNIVLNSGKNFSCFIGDDGLRADSVKVNITTKLDVLNNNADEVKGNTYTWILNENNYVDKEISMTLAKEKNLNLETIEVQNSSSLIFLVVAIVIVVIGGLIFLLIRSKLRKNNSF